MLIVMASLWKPGGCAEIRAEARPEILRARAEGRPMTSPPIQGEECFTSIWNGVCILSNIGASERATVMIEYGYDEFPALALVLTGQEKYRVVRTVSDAAEILISDWPTNEGEEYITAIRACLDAFHQVVPPTVVRTALIRAANAVRISHISVVC